MADSSEVDAAVIATLANDATLLASMTDGVYRDLAPQGKENFVVVSQLAHADTYRLQASAYEDFTYLVKAVSASTSGTSVKTAAARIHTLLQDAVFSVTGYGVMVCQRLERVAYAEADDSGDRRWQHRGGMYQVVVRPTA